VRIAIDYTPAVHQRAGIGRHTRQLVAALAAMAQDDHEITLLVYGRPADGSVPAPVSCRVRVVPVPNRWLSLAWHRARVPLPATWLSGAVDLYHAPDFVLPPVGAVPALLTVHDLSFLTKPECAEQGLRRYLSRVVPRSVARADHILADSEHTRQDLALWLDVPLEKTSVVYPGVEARFQPLPDQATGAAVRKRYGIGDRPFVLGVGTLEPRKNWPALIRAWARTKRRAALPHRLVLAGGKGWLYEDIFATAAASGFQEDIVFTGFVKDVDLPALYASADVFGYFSLYEGFGIPVVEAMACGVPVVCSDSSSLPEAAGDAAILVDAADEDGMADGLQRAIEDEALRSDLRARGLGHAASFTWEASAATLWQAYERVFAGAGASPTQTA
jgi:glycosyltransferase involved in cell wall biosynthesis